MLGWAALPGAAAIAAMIGLFLALSWSLTQQRQRTSTLHLPFGACLAPTILTAYLAQAVGLLQR